MKPMMTRSLSFVVGVCVVASTWLVIVSASWADPPAPQFSFPLFDGRSFDGWTAENGCDVIVDDGLLKLNAGDGWLRSDRTYADFVLHVEWKALQPTDYDAGIYIRTLPAGEPAEKCWQVRDGQLLCSGAPGPWLRSRDEFSDFNLRLDYQVSANGNSGVYVRVPADGNHHRENEQAPSAGFEVQVLDDAAPIHKDLKDYQYSASVYDIAGATRRVSKPAGQWNTLEINARGQRISVTHNGVVVVDLEEERFPLIKLRQTKGFLGLQNHSTLVAFRNLRVGPPLPFPAPSANPAGGR
jgi:hypothetical protein